MITELDLSKLAEDYGNNISHDQTEQGCAISGFIEGYKARDAVEQWISVEDRLPDGDDCICMVCSSDNSRAWAFYDTGTDAKGNRINFFREFYGDALISNVTHWQPLPSPPIHAGHYPENF